MSGNNTSSLLNQEMIAQTPAAIVENYSTLSAAVLFFYEYFLSFPLELQHIWQGRINTTKLLFIVNRYFGLIYLYGFVLIYFVKSPTNTDCRAFYYMTEISSAFITFAINSIFTLRTYAIYGRSKTVFRLLAIPGFVNVVALLWGTFTQSPAALPLEFQFGPWTCTVNVSSSSNACESNFFINHTFSSYCRSATLVNNVSLAVFDALVVILTLYRTGRLGLQSRDARISKSLSFVLLRDGALYYSAIFFPQLVLVILDSVVLRSSNITVNEVSTVLTGVINALQIVLVNRLILNLTHTANTREDSEFRTRTGLEPPTFATGTFLRNIGGPVRTLPDDLDDQLLESSGINDADGNLEIISVRDEVVSGVRSNKSQSGAGFELKEVIA